MSLILARQFGRAVARRLPYGLADALRAFYHGYILPWSYDRQERSADFPVVPPPALRHRVSGHADLPSFLLTGRDSVLAIERALSQAGTKATGAVLDFGCGCGRSALWWQRRHGSAGYHGCDIDAEAIRWAAANLPGTFFLSGFMPPLDARDASFDFVYSISVFTHLNAETQDAWLMELQRVTKPGGVLALSVHSQSTNAALQPGLRKRLDRDGMIFVPTRTFRRVFPDAYQLAYHTRAYIEAHWSRFFDLIGFEGMGAQDLVILRRRHQPASMS